MSPVPGSPQVQIISPSLRSLPPRFRARLLRRTLLPREESAPGIAAPLTSVDRILHSAAVASAYDTGCLLPLSSSSASPAAEGRSGLDDGSFPDKSLPRRPAAFSIILPDHILSAASSASSACASRARLRASFSTSMHTEQDLSAGPRARGTSSRRVLWPGRSSGAAE